MYTVFTNAHACDCVCTLGHCLHAHLIAREHFYRASVHMRAWSRVCVPVGSRVCQQEDLCVDALVSLSTGALTPGSLAQPSHGGVSNKGLWRLRMRGRMRGRGLVQEGAPGRRGWE